MPSVRKLCSFRALTAVSACCVQKAQARMEEIAAQLAATNDPSEIDRLGRLLQALGVY